MHGGGSCNSFHSFLKRVLERCGEQWDGDMDWFNFDRALVDEMSLLSGFFTLLVGEFAPGDPAYRYWSNHLGSMGSNNTINHQCTKGKTSYSRFVISTTFQFRHYHYHGGGDVES